MFIQDQQTYAALPNTLSEESHNLHNETCEVTFRLKYKLSYNGSWYYVWLEEKELQQVMPLLVLAYWKNLGGRCQTTQFLKYRVFRILAEEKRQYKVQWIGYSEEEFSWETKKKINGICPWAVLAWKAREGN
ncbi:hypothetical protein FSPOR_3586 [Fusarium sporotrichioides]|uniref:Chromo domain-containing protein n=1 Tax=Fusarium sporotrichioides TaxID=5514 RepID=A0A395SFN2_FUSSP|nr:hypothetical protein FSPOR_3586 [Fusarium sporotrichioides]